MEDKSIIDWIAMILLLVGGLNWGLVGLLEMDLVQLLFSSIPMLMKLVYVLVGLSALYMIYKVATKK